MSPLPRALARFNVVALNRVMRRLAPRLPGFALLTHVGRVSGRRYTIPVNVFRDDDGAYRIALTYGREAQWVRNVLAAGGCTLTIRGRTVELTGPRVVRDPSRSWAPAPVRLALGVIDVPDSMVLTASPRTPPPTPRPR